MVFGWFFFFNKHLQIANQRSKVKTSMEKPSIANFATAFNKSLVFTPTKEFLNDPKWLSDLHRQGEQLYKQSHLKYIENQPTPLLLFQVPVC